MTYSTLEEDTMTTRCLVMRDQVPASKANCSTKGSNGEQQLRKRRILLCKDERLSPNCSMTSLLVLLLCFLNCSSLAEAGKDREIVPTFPPSVAEQSDAPLIIPLDTEPPIKYDYPPNMVWKTIYPTQQKPKGGKNKDDDENDVEPSYPPVDSNTMSLSSQGQDFVGVQLPVVEIALTLPYLVLQDDAAVAVMLEQFLIDILSRNDESATFVSFDPITQTQRTSDQLVFTIGGLAYWKQSESTMTEQSLLQVLTTYFHFWGVADMQTSLQNAGVLQSPAFTDTSQMLQLSINGEPIQGSITTPQSQPGYSSESDASSSSSSASPNMGLIAGIVLSAVVVLLLMALCVLVFILSHRRRMSAVPKNPRADSSKGTAEEPSEELFVATTISKTPWEKFVSSIRHKPAKKSTPRSSTPRTTNSKNDDDDNKEEANIIDIEDEEFAIDNSKMFKSDDIISLSGIVSVEESLFTSTDASFMRGYDASRLDHVISSAKGFVDVVNADGSNDDYAMSEMDDLSTVVP